MYLGPATKRGYGKNEYNLSPEKIIGVAVHILYCLSFPYAPHHTHIYVKEALRSLPVSGSKPGDSLIVTSWGDGKKQQSQQAQTVMRGQ